MNDLIFAFLCKNKKTLFEFLRKCSEIGLYESVHKRIELINSYYVGHCSKSFNYTYADVQEWVFKVQQLVEQNPKIKFEYCYYGNIVVNTDINCTYLGVKYQAHKEFQKGGSCSTFCSNLDELKDRLYKFIVMDCKMECTETEIQALPCDFNVLEQFCERYEIVLTEVLHQYPGVDDEHYEQWKLEKQKQIQEDEENAQYEGIWYDDYEVDEKLTNIDSVFEFLEHHYRRNQEQLDKVIKARQMVEQIKDNFIEQ